MQRNGFRSHDPLERTARTPAMSFGPFAPPRHGRPPTPPVVYLWLVFWYLAELGLLTSGITWMPVTRLRIHVAGGVLPTTLPITGNLAALAALTGRAATAAGKVLVNARRAILCAVHDLAELLEATLRGPFRRTVKWRTGNPVPDQHTDSDTRWNATDRTRRRSAGPGPVTGYWATIPSRIAAPRRKSRIKDQQPRLLPTAGTSAADR